MIALTVIIALRAVEMPGMLRVILNGIAVGTGGASLMTMFRPFSNGLAAALFRTANTSHTLRLAARMVFLTILLALPGWFAIRSLLDQFFESSTPLLDRVSLEGDLIGYILLALAAVGFMVRRSLPETLERLGIRPFARAHIAVIAIGVLALYGLNAGADWIQHSYFNSLWESDHHVNEALATGLTAGRAIVLGLSAGIGEEITMRGALQPKLGLVLTSLLFAALHVQYSWFGMLVIFALGLILGTIRNRSSTSVAMAVHAIYDVLAVFSV